MLVESDLSGEMAVGDDELDAIIRLLGDALDDILSGTGERIIDERLHTRRKAASVASTHSFFQLSGDPPMTFRTAPQRDPLAPRRAALYLRVSTGRQAAGDVSIPSQRDLTRRFCEAQGWVVTAEFVEPGASATDDRRPAFQRMLDEATSPDRRFDIICVHAFSRFYRNGAEMELTIRKLRKHGVEVVSVTQPTGDDPSQEMMRQMIGIFDEYTSRENGKNVIRAMRESAKQGFWNGTTPPLGYRIVAAERRGSKVKKRLEIDPVEAELVRLIFRLYAEGDGRSGPLGVKETTKWLNEHGYRTRRGSTFGVGPLHRILKSSYYATGKWPYGRRNSRTGGLHDPATIVEIEIPPIIPLELVGKGPCTTCPQQSKGDSATDRKRPDAPHRAQPPVLPAAPA